MNPMLQTRAISPASEAELSFLATGRREALFAADMVAADATLREAIRGRRILVIGGAGSIGASTTELIADFLPAALHVIDQDENRLAEFVRNLRGRPQRLSVEDFRTLPLELGSSITRMFLESQPPYDAVLNFSAMKHVRSEKDPYSLLRILDTNILSLIKLLGWLARHSPGTRVFCVSTDKAANPTSLMGASKRLMEHTMFAGGRLFGLDCRTNSARFANVAFSNGSLLQGFLYRMAKQQPLALPKMTRRYFVSPEESGQICTLAAFAAPDRTIVIPRLHAEADLVELESVAIRMLQHFGMSPAFFDDEASAIAAVPVELAAGRYPILLTPLDTSGEKAYEEFVGKGETEREIGFRQLCAVDYVEPPTGSLEPFLNWLEAAVSGRITCSKPEIVEMIRSVVPHLQHIETGKNLDQRL